MSYRSFDSFTPEGSEEVELAFSVLVEEASLGQLLAVVEVVVAVVGVVVMVQ